MVKVICVCWGLFNQIDYISVETGRDYDAVLSNGAETTLQITKKNKDIMCKRKNTVHLFSTFHLENSKCFEKMKDGEETVSIRIN